MNCPLCSLSEMSLVWRSEQVMAVRDAHPVTPGHTLVIPRRHVETYFEATASEQAEIWRAVEEVKIALDREFAPDGYNVGFNVGAAAGQTVMHLHVHVIPRRSGDVEDPRGGVRGVIPSAQKYGDMLKSEPEARVVVGGREDPLVRQLLPALDGATFVDLALAFVFHRGVELLHDRLVDVLRRPNARVRIFTGDYQDVTEPDALRHLLTLPLIAEAHERSSSLEVRAYRIRPGSGDSFHPKAWVVRGAGLEVAWVGSSNLSVTALSTGLEWNYQIVRSAEVQGVHQAFESLWRAPRVELVDDDWIDRYERNRRVPTRGGRALEVAVAEDAPAPRPRPREGIQTEALLKLHQTRLEGNKAGMVVLATGLGKTFLSAFDSSGFERVLFVAHREEILTQALETYRRVRPGSRLGLYYGKQKDERADVLFASIQTLGSPEHLETFEADEFDYIVVDEFHRAAASTYRRVLDYFEPRFMLGLTATPDRLDGVNLLSLCEGNEVYRCDIARGIEDGQLAPFHYYGIGDETQYEQIPWRRYTEEKLAELVATEQRARHALETFRKYTSGRAKALGFCVTKGHADFMANYFRQHGVDCEAVYSGSKAQRAPSLEALSEGRLEIVFCVDMFNEGVDVPGIDTVFMLRPTQSSIIWLQQLGRGLRYVEDKTLTVLDYIGNHNVFLRRPEMLLEALNISLDRPSDAWWEAPLRANLPPGVQLTFDLEARDVLTSLRRASSRGATKAERWYRQVRDLRGERPTALEADRAGWLKQLSKKSGGWFQFVADEGDLLAEQQAVLQAHPQWFAELEQYSSTKSHEMLVLLALLHLDPFPGRVEKRAISDWIATRARRSAVLMRDLSVDGSDGSAIRNRLEEHAFPRLRESGFLSSTKSAVDSSKLATEHPEALADLTRELVDLKLTRYLETTNRSSARLPPIQGDDGTPVDARFDVEMTGDRSTVVFHSRGGTRGSDAERNTEYRKGLEILLGRLKRAGLDVERIEVISDNVMKAGLSQEHRTIALTGFSYPVTMGELADARSLARSIGAGAKKVGQKPGTTGGNDTRKIRITLVQNVPAGELWGLLFSGRSG